MTLAALLDAEWKTPPWRHQLAEMEISAERPERALLWQMRTGKSKMILDTASWLYKRGLIDALLIFGPNGVHANWVERELGFHLWDSVPFHAAAWSTRVAGLKGGNRLSAADKRAWEDVHAEWWKHFDERIIRGAGLSVLAFNSESMTRKDVRKAIAKLCKKRRVMCVWDESTDFRTPGSARTLMARAVARHVAYRRILDGTSVTNSPLHSFSQFELLRKEALGFSTFGDFKERYAVFEDVRGSGGRSYKKLKEYQNLDELRRSMARYSSVVLRSDCSDLPPVVERTREIELTETQLRVYREVKAQLEIEVNRGELATLKSAAPKLMKLQQVVGGFLRDEAGKDHRIPGGNPKLEALSEEVFLAGGPVIIWCQFQWEIDEVKARMKVDGWNFVEYHGRVSEVDKQKVRRIIDGPEEDRPDGIIAQWQSGARGLNFSWADKMVAYSHTFDAIIFAQAKERATAMGGGNIELVLLVAPPIDVYLLGRVDHKVSIADDLAGRGLKAILAEL